MIYKFNKDTLEFQKISLNRYIAIGIAIVFSLGFGTSQVKTVLVEGEKKIKIESENTFSKDKLKEEIAKFNFKYPDIVYAQAIIESGGFKSNVFLENNNIFGMREAGSRVTTALGTKNNHAYYQNWKTSVADRAIYEGAYLRGLSRSEYLQFLKKNYAEATDYDKAILKTIKNN